MRHPRTFPALLAACILTAAPAAAQADASPGGPCAYRDIDLARWGYQPFRNAPEIRSVNGRLSTRLEVRYTDRATTRIAGCPVKLRSYNGQLVGPTLRVRPGDVLAPTLVNDLPVESVAQRRSDFVQQDTSAYLDMHPYSYNTTNLHTHGLHVSPQRNSDNVLLAIAPQTRQPYDIRLPRDHTRGTYWYHAHTHGSTAIQVGSGMAGALIVDDDPAKIPAALRAANEREKIMLISTVLYDTAGQVREIAAFFPDGPGSPALCRQGSPTCTWQSSKRRTTINGQIVPVIRMRPGEVQRWRMIDGAFRESMFIQLEDHPLHEIALDGIYTGRIDTWPAGQSVELQPGYRSDVLVQARRRPGSTARADTFRITDGASPPGRSIRGIAEDAELIGIVIVEGEPMGMQLPTQAEMAALDPFPGVDLSRTAVNVQEVVFKLGTGLRNPNRNYFQVNYAAFNDSRVRHVKLNDTDMWSVTTIGDPAPVPNPIPPLPHVFHIHVNPFQVARFGPDSVQQTVWRDTQLIPAGDTLNLYTRYTEFLGKFVMHCHILDHEDLGMMEVVEVVRELPVPHPPATTGRAGRTATPAHGAHPRPPAGSAPAPGGSPGSHHR